MDYSVIAFRQNRQTDTELETYEDAMAEFYREAADPSVFVVVVYGPDGFINSQQKS